ncbi:DMT family transporter [Pseudoalteromonas denitrificans]|uniref:EamA-like transporter family protein n=1 Tax=Pseudoalteromonas denitrificans DSM 6059 TaxID=1123010 RepID=A0A1I1KIQ7_9GAMM|nr:DMT family transporter [Pseudoalteromonas denitrificans]SFC60687.1 EamA-like transporter family protein [Pseudoalteromonas denitrificans DSM 6059]
MSLYPIKIIISTVCALIAFAGNSVLCRIALGQNLIDAASFTNIRLLSGIVTLMLIVLVKKKHILTQSKGSWLASCMLFVYAIAFSYGYISLDTGVGALILFGSVQITLIFVNVTSGNKLHYSEWLGLSTAFVGFVYLIFPSLTSPTISGMAIMALSGVAWAFYTLLGRSSQNPLSDTAYNFLRTLPFILFMFLLSFKSTTISQEGIVLAVLSGALASGIGYVIWYIALNELSISQAGVVQLFVPVIAAIGGVLFAQEQITLRLFISSVLVLGGILIVILGKSYCMKQALNEK